jgi:hypothetical protein
MRNNQYSPNQAGFDLLKDVTKARRQLNKANRQSIRNSGLVGDQLFWALCEETARIKHLDCNEVFAELKAIQAKVVEEAK